MCTCNANALFHLHHDRRAAKRSFVSQLVRGIDIVILQEVHGDAHEFEVAWREIQRHFHVRGDAGRTGGAGGVITLVARAWMSLAILLFALWHRVGSADCVSTMESGS